MTSKPGGYYQVGDVIYYTDGEQYEIINKGFNYGYHTYIYQLEGLIHPFTGDFQWVEENEISPF